MNRFLKKTLRLFGVFFLCVMFFSCEMYDVDYNDYHTSVEADCDDSVYDKNEGIYKGEIFLVRDVRFPYGDRTYDSVDVRLGNHVNKELEIMELPVKSLFDRYEDRKLLADIPSWVLEKNINITFKYKLYFKILFELLKEGEVVDIDIDSIISNDFSDSRGSIEIDYHHRIYADSVYNEDKTQKLKFDVEGYVYYIGGDEEAINLSFNKLEINDKVFIDENNNPRYLKIIISRKRNTKINLNKQTVV